MRATTMRAVLALVLLGAVLLAACSDDNPTTPPADTTPPTIVSFTPADGDTDVAVDAAVQVVFSEAMDQATADTGSVHLVGADLTGLSWSGDHTLVVAHAPFPPGSHVTLQVGTALADAAGNHLAAPGQASFTVAAAPDTTAPTVVSITPPDGAEDVTPDADVVIVFSEAMDPATADGHVTMTGGTITNLEWTAADTLVVHHATWTMKAMVTVAVDTNLADLAGNHLAQPASSTFSVTIPDTTPPTVTATTPADGATDVALDAAVTVTFSESMDRASLAGHVTIAEASVDSLTWSDDHTLVVHHPDFPAGTEIHVTVDDAATDLAGNHLADAYTFSFTTLTPDTTPPTVVSITPPDGAEDVTPDTDVVIVFSEAMDQATANGNVTMTGGTITGLEWTAADTLVVHHEAWTLKSMVTVTVGTGLADLAGNHLAAPVSSTFSVTVPDTTPPTITAITPADGTADAGIDAWLYIDFSEPVDQASFQDAFGLNPPGIIQLRWYDGWTRVAIIHPDWTPGATVSLDIGTGLTDLAGNHLAAPFHASFTVGSDDVRDPELLRCTVYDGQADVPQDAQPTLIFSENMARDDWPDVWFEGADMDTFYWDSDFMLRLVPEHLELGATVTLHVGGNFRDLAGKWLSNPQTITFTVTDVDVVPPAVEEVLPPTGSTDIPANQVVVFIFTEPMDTLTTDVSLSEGDVTSTWWHDPYALVVEHTDWTAGHEVTVTAGTGLADPAGNHLVEPASTTFTVTDADHTAPYVAVSVPADGDTDVDPEAPLQFVFSERVVPVEDPALVTLSSGEVLGLEWEDEQTLLVAHTPWAAGETVTATVDAQIMDFAFNWMEAPYTITFTVGAPPDTTPPEVVSHEPADGAVDVDPDADVIVVFSEAMNQADVNGRIVLSEGVITGMDWPDDHTLVVHHQTWPPATTITVALPAGAQDLAGNGMVDDVSWQFTTGQGSDTTPPVVIATQPLDGATGVDPDTEIVVQFSEPMDMLSLEDNIEIMSGAISVNDLVWLDPQTVRLVHDTLPAATTVSMRVNGVVSDLAGNVMGSDYTWQFTTAGGDTEPPTVVGFEPADGATGVARDADVVVTFSEPMDPMCVANYLRMSDDGITGIEWLDDHTVRLDHDPWTAGQAVTVTVQAGACDLAGNTLQQDVSATFTVTDDTTPPELVNIEPADGSDVEMDMNMITMEFSEPIDPDSFSLAEVNGQLAVLLDVDNATWSPDGTVLTVPLLDNVPAGATLHAVIGHFEDLAGNANTTTTSWTVTEVDPGDEVIVDPYHLYGYLNRSTETADPVWNGQWYNEYRRHEWENQAAGEFRLNYIYDLGTPPDEWDYGTLSDPWFLLRGFHETDEGVPSDSYFTAPVRNMPLDPTIPQTWSGSTFLVADGDTVQVDYAGTVLAGTTDVEVPQPDPEQAVADRVFWQGCRTVILEHTILAGSDTMAVGVDTLHVVTGYGLVEERNYEEDRMEGSWSWDQTVMNARLTPLKPR